jgi:hypothetical protein
VFVVGLVGVNKRSRGGAIALPSGPYLHFDAAQEVYSDFAGTTPAVDGGDVRNWKDLAGARDAQNNNANQPKYKTNAINSLPSVIFDGDELLTFASMFALLPASFFLVGKDNNPGGSVFVGEGGSANYIYWATDQYFNCDGGFSRSPANSVTPGSWHIGSGVVASGLVTSIVDNAAGAPVAASTWEGRHLGRYLIAGSAQDLIGEIAELIVYDRALTPDELTAGYNFLKAKYALP